MIILGKRKNLIGIIVNEMNINNLELEDFNITNWEELGQCLDFIEVGLSIRSFDGDIKYHNDFFLLHNDITNEKSLIGKNIKTFFPDELINTLTKRVSSERVIHERIRQTAEDGMPFETKCSFMFVQIAGEPHIVNYVSRLKVVNTGIDIQIQQIVKKIKEIRLNESLSQSDFAEKFGVSVRTYQRIENHHTNPSLEFLLQIAKHYHIELNHFVA